MDCDDTAVKSQEDINIEVEDDKGLQGDNNIHNDRHDGLDERNNNESCNIDLGINDSIYD